MLEFELIFPDDERFVTLAMTGTINRERATDVATQVNKALEASERPGLLVDLRACRNVDTPANNFFYAKDDTKAIGLVPHDRIAFLVEPADYSHEFVATAMRNSGYNVQIFRDLDIAMGWLNQA